MGSTPTIVDDGWVATTDNADPVNVVVYRRGPATDGGSKEVCRVPEFDKDASAVTLAPDGAAFIGVLGGLVKITDGP